MAKYNKQLSEFSEQHAQYEKYKSEVYTDLELSKLETLLNYILDTPQRQIEWSGSNSFMLFAFIIFIIIQIILVSISN